MRPRLVLVALVTLLAATFALGGVAAAQSDPASDPDGDATTDDQPVPGGDIIPEPDSGVAPQDAGDRGGALQLTVLVAIVGGVATIAVLAVRESRRARARRDGDGPEAGPDAGQPSDAYSSQPG